MTDTAHDPVLEIVTFRLKDGVQEPVFIDAARGTEAPLRAFGGLLNRTLTKDDDGLWTDVVEWRDRATAQAAAEAVMAMPDFAPFGDMIDGESVRLRHAAVLWRME